MDKKEVFNILKTKGRFYCQEKQFIKRFPDIYDDICRIDFPDDFTLIQKIYHYFMDDPDLKLGICPVCGNRCKFKNLNFGYWNHCSSNCASIDKDVVDKLHQTNLKKYGVESVFQSDDVKEKRKKTYIEHYGFDSPMKNKEFNRMWFESKKKNNTCNTSKIETRLSEYLSQKSISFITQYTSDLYPYHCDFYLPDYDLYVEIQGTWTHGFHPFDKNSNEDKKKLNYWLSKSETSNFYKTAINVWCYSDVEKRETAKNNGLNYLEIFSIDFDYCVEQILNRLKSGA